MRVTPQNQLLQLTDMVGRLEQEAPTDECATLDDLVGTAAEAVPGAQYAGLAITGRRHLETPPTTGRYPLLLGEIQGAVGEGRCLSAARGTASDSDR